MVSTDRPTLAVRLPNWVGDVIMTLPTIVQLQQAGFDLQLVGRAWANDLLSGLSLPFLPLPKGLTAGAWRLRILSTDRGLLFTNSLSSALTMRLAGIRPIGYKSDCRNALLHTGLVRIPARHEVEYFWRLGMAAAATWAPLNADFPIAPPAHIELPLTFAHRLAAKNALSHAQIFCPYTVCCPMAAGTTLGQSKQWPHFAELCRRLSEAGKKVVICPGPGEERHCQPFFQHAVVLPRLSLGAYAALMSEAEMVIANDSGPMHLADAVGATVLGIFGMGDPERTRPWSGRYMGGYGQWPGVDEIEAAVLQSTEAPHRQTALKHAIAA